MKEIVPGENRLTRLDLPETSVRLMRALDDAIAERSQIVWGEHCSECAYPSCYASCAYYTPRSDLRCRRFERGIEAVKVADWPASLMRIRFRKWGKLEGKGPAPLRPRTRIVCHEVVRELVGKVADVSELPSTLRHKIGRAWMRAEDFLRRHGDPGSADAFVVECVSLGDGEVPFTVTVLPQDRLEPGLFQERIALGPGYTRHVIPVAHITPHVDVDRPFVIQIEPLVESPKETFVFGVVDFVRWAQVPAPAVMLAPGVGPRKKAAARAKCVVWDLDDTLWEGILNEVGVEGVKVRQNALEVIRALDARGILHSIASKNNEVEVLAALRHFGIEELFLYPQIGWGPKSESLEHIAKLLNIDIDALAFVDDQSFERAEVLETLGCVTTFPHTNLEDLLQHPLFDVPPSAESAKRRLMYREEMQRHAVFQATASSDRTGFLRACQIRMNLSLLSDDNITRIYELSQRTNQVNVTGTRYERRTVEELARSPGSLLPIVVKCQDRFGDYGIVGFVLLDPGKGLIIDYFMSCRVQRKCVENALFAQLVNLVAARGTTVIRCRYRRTERNTLALELLGDLGFRLHDSDPSMGFLERDLSPIAGADVVTCSTDDVIFRNKEVKRPAGASEFREGARVESETPYT